MDNPPIIPFPQRDDNRSASTKRLTPQSLEAEQSTIGAMLLERDRNVVARAVALLQPEDFYRELHKKIYKCVLKLFDKGEPIDIVTVAEELRRNGQLDDVGGPEYLSALIEVCPSSANIEAYARVVGEKSVLRQLLKASDEIAGWAYADGTEDVEEVVYRSESCISNISRKIYPAVSTHVKPILMAAYDQIERRFQHKGEATGISTGFTDLDDITSGLQPSELIVLASAASMGKTALALNIAYHIALKERQPIAVFSLEMTKEQVVQRLICSEASIKSHDLRRGKVQDSDWHRITNAVNNIYQAPFFIHDKPRMTSHEISSEARRLCGEHGQFGLIVIDYLQLVRPNQRTENRTQDIGETVREFKALARELKAPILLLSQLSRMVEQREDKRPMLSDLRDSGTVGEDADVVAFIYRPSYYKRKMLHKDGQPDPNAEPDPDEGLAEVIIGKQRNGPVGTIRLGFQPEYARFTNLARNAYGGEY